MFRLLIISEDGDSTTIPGNLWQHSVTIQKYRKHFLMVQGNLLFYSLYAVLLVPGHHWIVSDSSPLHPHSRYLYTLMRFLPTRPLVSRLKSPQYSQTGEMPQSLHKLSSPLVNSFQCFCICLVPGSPELHPVFQYGLPWAEERITPLAHWQHCRWSRGDWQPSSISAFIILFYACIV